MNKKLTLLLYILYLFICQLQAESLVKISQGLLKGTRFLTRKERNISAFIGIPYAQPPVGELRFKSPLPAETWDGLFLANKEASPCPQDYHGQIFGDEDCLYLNVFTPVLEFNSSQGNDHLLPVMVFIHGGGYSKESTELADYSPQFLMDKNIVFVSMNYRLGILGFLSTGDLVSPGNYALKDQTLALKWVQKNIRAFGGDPNRITLFGNSAGAACVNLLALSDAANGLFNQYIIESGTVIGNTLYRRRTEFQPAINYIANYMGCSTNNSTDFVKCLRDKSFIELMTAMKYVNDEYPLLTWIPTDEMESEDAFLTDTPLNLLAQNKMKDLPVIAGTVVDEGLIATQYLYANISSAAITPEFLEDFINSTSIGYYASPNINKFVDIIKDYYFDESISFTDRDKLLENITRFFGDSAFYYPQVILLENMAKYVKSPIYSYNFGYRGSSTLFSVDTNITENFGVAHGDELIYLFPMSNTVPPTETDEHVTDLMVDLWTSFAINGKPTSDELDDPDLWQPYNENGNFLQIGNIKNNTDPSVTNEQEYYTDRMNFWSEHFSIV